MQSQMYWNLAEIRKSLSFEVICCLVKGPMHHIINAGKLQNGGANSAQKRPSMNDLCWTDVITKVAQTQCYANDLVPTFETGKAFSSGRFINFMGLSSRPSTQDIRQLIRPIISCWAKGGLLKYNDMCMELRPWRRAFKARCEAGVSLSVPRQTYTVFFMVNTNHELGAALKDMNTSVPQGCVWTTEWNDS